jgi:hypothetical protein
MAAILGISDLPEYTALSMWKVTFDRGFYLCPTQAMFSSFIFLVNALLTLIYGQPESSSHNCTLTMLMAGILAISLVPFTLVVIVPLEETLLKRHEKLSREDINAMSKGKIHSDTRSISKAIESRRVMGKWVSLNYVRTILPALTVTWIWLMCI